MAFNSVRNVGGITGIGVGIGRILYRAGIQYIVWKKTPTLF